MTAFGDGDPVGRFDPRQNKMPVPVTGIFDNPRNCVAINVDWRGYLIGVIERLAWGDIWDGSEAEQDRAVQEIYKLVNELATGECEVPTIFRQDPTRPCVMQYSTDDGTNWSDAFDYSQCTAIATSQTATEIQGIFNADITFNASTMVTYNGDIANTSPDFEYDGTGTDVYRNEALCWAIRTLVDMVCDGAVDLINDQNSDTQELVGVWRNISGVAQVLTGALALASVFPAAAAISGLAFALSSVLVDIAATILADNPDDYLDEDARETVACLMYDHMKDATPTFAAWDDSADGSATGAAETIRLTMVEAVKSEETFVQLLIAFNDVVALGTSIPSCVCEVSILPISITFAALTDPDWTVTDAGIPNTTVINASDLQSNLLGNPVPSAKAAYIETTPPTDGIGLRVRVELDITQHVTSVDFDYYFDQPINNVLARTITLLDSSENVVDTQSTSLNDATRLAWTTYSWSGDAIGVKYIDVQINVISGNALFTPSSVYGYIDNVEIA